MFLPLAFENLHVVLRTLFDKMLPLCSEMTAIASGIAGLGALLYISYRVWQSLARAEPIDVFPLLRPFALGLCILFFEPLVLGTINGILSPVVQGTHKLLVGQTFDMGKYQKDKQELMKATAEANFDQLATAQTGEETTAMLEEMNLEPADLMALQQMYEESSSWSLKGMITKAFHWLLELLFDCASLIIDTIRTFFLIVLAILGPLAFAVAVYDGFHASLTQWLSKYISVYLWLPISDLFGAILARLQVLSIQKDMEMLAIDPSYTFSAEIGASLVFLLIGICGYFTIPSIAGWIVHASGIGSYNRIVTHLGAWTLTHAAGIAGSTIGNVAGRAREGVRRHIDVRSTKINKK